jgi:hypothetical protein
VGYLLPNHLGPGLTVRARRLVLPLAVALAGGALPAPADAAAADCSIELPATVVIDSETAVVHAQVSPDCLRDSGPVDANWLFGHGTGPTTPLHFDAWQVAGPSSMTAYAVIGDRDPTGVYTATPAGAQDADSTPMTQNTARTVVKYASSFGAGLLRTRTALSWDIDAMTWSGRTHGWYPRAGAQVSVWHLPLDGTAWKYLRTQTMSSRGTGTVTVENPNTGHYRLSMAETATVWGTWSPPVASPAVREAAVPGCHLAGPTTLVVGQARQTVHWYLGKNCAEASGGGATASWQLRDPSGAVVETIDIEAPSQTEFYDFHQFTDTAPKGRYRLTPAGITPSNLTQNSTTLDVKYESRTRLSGSWRPGGDVTITATATSWSGRLHDWYPRQGVQVQLMWRPQADFVWEIAPWTWVRNGTTGSTGRATFSLPNARLGEYQVRVLETASVWGSGSATYFVG